MLVSWMMATGTIKTILPSLCLLITTSITTSIRTITTTTTTTSMMITGKGPAWPRLN